MFLFSIKGKEVGWDVQGDYLNGAPDTIRVRDGLAAPLSQHRAHYSETRIVPLPWLMCFEEASRFRSESL